jgi:hypothetical protein
MKTFFALIAALVTLSASGQQSGVVALTFATNSVTATTTNFYSGLWGTENLAPNPSGSIHPGVVLPCGEFDAAGLTCVVSPAASGSGSVVFNFCKSFDGGIIFEDNPSVRVSLTVSGLNSTHIAQSVDLTSVNFLGLYSIENSCSCNITNCSIKFNLKSRKNGAYSVPE